MLGVKSGKSPAGRMAAPEVLTPLIAMGDTFGKEVLVPALLTAQGSVCSGCANSAFERLVN